MLNNENKLYCGDNLQIMYGMPNESVDLIYLDPPFFSGQNYEILWGDGTEAGSFKDTGWYRVECPNKKCKREVSKEGENYCPVCGTSLNNAKEIRKDNIWAYIDWMIPRLKEMHRILKSTGSIYLHCDYHAVHYLKVEMDRMFGTNNFQNEIIWQRTNAKGKSTENFNINHDTILVYKKDENHTFNVQFNEIEVPRNAKEDDNGFYVTQPVIVKKRGSKDKSRTINGKKITLDDKHGWYWSQGAIDEYESSGSDFEWSSKNIPRYKKYIVQGRPCEDIWCGMYLHPSAKERLGYPTQKPEALLERIIKASSNPGDVMLDPFCGCGTSTEVARKLKRKYIGIDISPNACKLIGNRVDFPMNEIIGLPRTPEEIGVMDANEFQDWVCKKMSAKNTSSKTIGKSTSPDGGIDGIIERKVTDLKYNGALIQVKQSTGVGVKTAREFLSVMTHEFKRRTDTKNRKENIGFIVGLSFSKDVIDLVEDYKNDGSGIIHLLTVKDIIDVKFFNELVKSLKK